MSAIKNTTQKFQSNSIDLAGTQTTKVTSQRKLNSVSQPELQIASSSTRVPKNQSELTQKLALIIENSKTNMGAIKQIFSSSVGQAKADKAAGKGLIEGTHGFTKTISDMQGLFTQHARKMGYSSKQQEQLNVDQLGAIARNYTREGIRNTLLDGAASTFGVKPEALAGESLFDLTRYNLDLFSSSETATIQGIQSAGTGATTITSSAPAASSVSGGTVTAASGASLSAQLLGGIGAAYSGFQLISNWGNSDPVSGAINGFTAGAYIGTMVGGPIGAAIGGVIGGVVGLASGFFKKSGKSEEQVARDKVRDALKQNGVVSTDWKLTLADGSAYDIGKDGRFKLDNVDGTKRHAYEIDFKNPLAGETVGMLQPIVAILTGPNTRLTRDFIGYFTNAALSNATDLEGVRKNVLSIYKTLKMSPEQVMQGISTMVEKGMISKDEGMAYVNGFGSLLQEAKKPQTNKPVSRNPRLKATQVEQK
jgi:polyhydroxyalkanoate synthesis regulator phasin